MAPEPIALLGELPTQIGGRWVGHSTAADRRAVGSVAIDSRAVEPGALFFALPGERTDGHHFVSDAAERGAVAAVVTSDRAPDGSRWTLPALLVDDALTALHRLAEYHVARRLATPVRIAITGSNGKTTTKELARAALAAHAPTYASPGNLNSETGVPLAVFAAPHACHYAVFELAMNNPGEIAPLARIVKPHLAIITGIGTAHIGRLGSREAIAREKRDVASAFTGSEALLIPEDDDFRDLLSEGIRGRVHWFGPETQRAQISAGPHPGWTTIRMPEGEARIPLPGVHNGRNALAVAALCRELAVPFETMRRGISEVTLPPGRSRLVPLGSGGVILDESYNANRESMVAALDAARSLATERAVVPVALLGSMAELGAHSEHEHRAVLAHAIQRGYPLIVCVGEAMGAAAAAMKETGESEVLVASDADEAATLVARRIRGDEVIMVKGSRSSALERAVDALGQRVPAVRGGEGA